MTESRHAWKLDHRDSAKDVGLGEFARSILKDGRSVYASVLRIEGDQVTLQVFQNTRGISTEDKVTFLKRQMQATYGDSLLGRRLSGTGEPIDGVRISLASRSISAALRLIL